MLISLPYWNVYTLSRDKYHVWLNTKHIDACRPWGSENGQFSTKYSAAGQIATVDEMSSPFHCKFHRCMIETYFKINQRLAIRSFFFVFCFLETVCNWTCQDSYHRRSEKLGQLLLARHSCLFYTCRLALYSLTHMIAQKRRRYIIQEKL